MKHNFHTSKGESLEVLGIELNTDIQDLILFRNNYNYDKQSSTDYHFLLFILCQILIQPKYFRFTSIQKNDFSEYHQKYNPTSLDSVSPFLVDEYLSITNEYDNKEKSINERKIPLFVKNYLLSRTAEIKYLNLFFFYFTERHGPSRNILSSLYRLFFIVFSWWHPILYILSKEEMLYDFFSRMKYKIDALDRNIKAGLINQTDEYLALNRRIDYSKLSIDELKKEFFKKYEVGENIFYILQNCEYDKKFPLSTDFHLRPEFVSYVVEYLSHKTKTKNNNLLLHALFHIDKEAKLSRLKMNVGKKSKKIFKEYLENNRKLP